MSLGVKERQESAGVPAVENATSASVLSMFKQLADGRSFVAGSGHPSGLATATRLTPPPERASGYEDAFIASPELVITARHIDAAKSFADEERGLGRLAFVFHLGGERRVEISGIGTCHLNGPSFNVHYLPPGSRKRSTWCSGGRETAVVIGFWAGRLPQAVQDALGPESALRKLCPQGDGTAVWLERPLSAEMEQAARQVLYPKVHGSLLSAFLVAKANELLCLGLDSVFLEWQPQASASRRLQSQVRRAIALLERDLRNTPSTNELARSVDLPVASLVYEFQRTYGMAVPEFVMHLRMKAAHEALLHTDQPLKRISYEIGYQHTSNFCTAFKRYFGRTPTEARRAGVAAPCAYAFDSDTTGIAAPRKEWLQS